MMDSTHISALHAKHAGLEARLRNETARPAPDTMLVLVANLKKQKLILKQQIAQATG